MVGVRVGPPRPGKREDRSQSIGLKEFKKPLAEVTVVGLLPGASAAIAVVRWTNPAGRFKTLDPASMQILLLEELPHMAGGSSRRLNVEGTRAMLREVLPLPARDDAPVFIYVRDNVHGAAFVTGSSGVELVTQGALDDLLAATRGLGATAVSRLPSSVLSRTLRLGGPALRTKRALETAWRVFPQSLPLMRTATHDWPKAAALLLVAHVIGASVELEAEAQPEAEPAAPAPAAPAAALSPAAPAAAPAAPAARAPPPAAPAAAHGPAPAQAPAPAAPAALAQPEAAAAVPPPLVPAPPPAGGAPVVPPPTPGPARQPMRGAGAKRKLNLFA